MGSLTAIFIVGFIVLGIYKIIELLVKRKERLTLIEKLFTHCEKKDLPGSFQLPEISFGNRDSWALKIALLLIGIGTGCLLALITVTFINTTRLRTGIDDTEAFTYFAYIAICGGIGLLISHRIESKQSNKK